MFSNLINARFCLVKLKWTFLHKENTTKEVFFVSEVLVPMTEDLSGCKACKMLPKFVMYPLGVTDKWELESCKYLELGPCLGGSQVCRVESRESFGGSTDSFGWNISWIRNDFKVLSADFLGPSCLKEGEVTLPFFNAVCVECLCNLSP